MTDALVVTRAQTERQRRENALIEERERLSGAQPNPIKEESTQTEPEPNQDAREESRDEQSSETEADEMEEFAREVADLDEELFQGGREKEKQSRRQKRANRQKHAERKNLHPLDLSMQELKQLQGEDETLAAVRRGTEGEISPAGRGFFKKEGLIYRRWTPPGRDEEEMAIEQLVLPQKCRKVVLELAHNIPLAGHKGKNKTAQRIMQRFYWPTLYKDTAEYCRTCAECQKTSNRKGRPAPLISLPIIEEPFQRIAMDIVGPLPRSRSGKRYVLVVCDYATRYPEAIPLHSIDAEHIAEELMKLFARVGVPKEILTDQGSNFTSQLLGEVYRLLHIHPIRTSPYHPQTDGLVERFNQTLKTMLRKTAKEEGKNWDKLLPYVLFAYREVPQASTGFSPFELLYGRQVRGPLDVLRETWESSSKSSESIVSYVINMREKMDRMTELVQENLAKAQKVQKQWYDKNARTRELKKGDLVLVLLPTSSSKLLAQWQGPYQVEKKVGKVNYVVDMADRRKRKRIFHVNMLKQWHTPTHTNYLAEEVDDEEDVPVWNEDAGTETQPTLGDQLSDSQQEQLHEVLQDFTDVMKSEPGRTMLAEHRIETGDARPIRQPPYRLPYAYKDEVLRDLKEMQEKGIIEPSASEWSSPIVLVKKKDGTLRMCVDYRRLNSVSQADAYPMPRIDNLIDRLGKAKYITTIDLTRGYWQVPVAEASRSKTAFTTLLGLFQFRVMPFGLHGAPATFQRMMDRLLDGLGDFSGAYLDDLVIYSTSWQEHLEHLRTIMERLRGAGLIAKPSKCQFGMSHCVYLGHIVGNGVVRPEPSKIESVQSFPIPQVKKQVRAFLGLTGYYRKFIPNYATIALPLTDLTRKNAPNKIEWSSELDAAFKLLKSELCSSPVLASPDFSRPFVLQTDASDRGVGAVLSQCDESGSDHPVAYFSRKLLPREERYSTIEKECLAIKLGVKAFKVYLLGKPFMIQTDHRTLEWLDRLKEDNARLTRWSLLLQPYQFTVCHRAGKANANADALSRINYSTSATN